MQPWPRSLLLLLLACLPAACTNTSLTQYDAMTGNKVLDFRTNANLNLAPVGETTDRNAMGGLPLLGNSGVDQVRRTSATPVVAALDGTGPTLRVGDMLEIYGTVDHATPIRERWIGIRGVAKSLVVGVLGHTGLTEWGAARQAEIAADRAIATGAQGVEVEGLRQATQQASLASEERVLLEQIANQP